MFYVGLCLEFYNWTVRIIRDLDACVWTGEFDLNMPLIHGELFEFGKKKNCGFKNIQIHVGGA